MGKKIVSLHEARQRKKPRSMDEVLKVAARHYFSPEIAALEEPLILANGKVSTDGKFVNDGDDEIDDEDLADAR